MPLLVAAFLVVVLPAAAEAPKSGEVVGHVGAFRFGGDEGWGDTSVGYGGTITAPFARRWAVEMDVVTGFTSRSDLDGTFSENRRTLLTGHIVYRRGTERVYWFVGVGPGIQMNRNHGRFHTPTISDPTPILREASYTENNFAALGYKTGAVVSITGTLLIRFELQLQHTTVLPDTTARVGIGWRF